MSDVTIHPALDSIAAPALTEQTVAADATTVASVSWTDGIEAAPRSISYGDNSWVSATFVVILILLALNIKHLRRLFHDIPHDLLIMRRRPRRFDDNDTGAGVSSLLLIMLLIVAQGTLIYSAGISSGIVLDTDRALTSTLMLCGLALAFYVFQLTAFAITGYTFTDTEGTASWLRAYGASQSLLAVTLVVPALVSLFYPATTGAMLILAIIAYIIARLLLFCKEFSIFYNGFTSLFYFILYLCTLEIIPVIIARRLALDIMLL